LAWELAYGQHFFLPALNGGVSRNEGFDETVSIGDMPSDAEAAHRAGIAYLPAATFFNWT
jgi:hypothetical protein